MVLCVARFPRLVSTLYLCDVSKVKGSACLNDPNPHGPFPGYTGVVEVVASSVPHACIGGHGDGERPLLTYVQQERRFIRNTVREPTLRRNV
eukprot:4016653-Amphidinium_carterae.1